MLAIQVDFSSAVPVYRQIADELRALIAQGQLADGAELPSVRDLSGRVGVNLNTVAKAYRILSDEGVVDLRHGSRAKVQVPSAPYRRSDMDDVERRLEDVVSRLVLAGASRKEVERMVQQMLERFFDCAK
ncbi:MAG TPA: GntR family transcriptional regulator [Polyangiaceae bacterium]|nr:GntR family transcriptional regulator [Polyangiaceae bacterium]